VNGAFYLLKNEQIKENLIRCINDIDVKKEVLAVKIEPWSEPRTKKQNRYLWGWVYANIVMLLNESGQCITLKDGREMDWTVDVLHEAFKTVYLALPAIETKKGEIRQFKSTSELSKKEFTEYMDNIDKACSGWWAGIYVPVPTAMWADIYSEIKL